MHVGIELIDEELEHEHTENEEKHLNIVSEAHGLEPYPETKLMRSHATFKVTGMIKPVTLLLVIVHVAGLRKS